MNSSTATTAAMMMIIKDAFPTTTTNVSSPQLLAAAAGNNNNKLTIVLPFYVLGIMVLSSYALLVRAMWLMPSAEAIEGVWAGLKTSADGTPRPVVFGLWIFCEAFAAASFIALTLQLWNIENVGNSVFGLYSFFLIFSAAWAPLTLARKRNLVLLDLAGAAICAWGLLIACMPLLSSRACWMLPVALQTTFMDLCFWGWSWSARLQQRLIRQDPCDVTSCAL